VKTPDSDMQIAAKFAGRLDFNTVKEIVSLDDMTINGLLECDLTLAGRMSTLENEQYEDFQAAGMLKLSDFNYVSPDFPQGVKITGTQLDFTPKVVNLVNFDAIVGRTDISMNGSLENFIPYVFKDETVRGKLTLKSNTIDLNEFMTDEPEEAAAPADTVPMSVIEVPKNIDFVMNANIGKILFDKLTIANTAGVLTVKDGKVNMQNLGMNLLEGSMVLNGEYNTQNIKVPFINFDMDINKFDITTTISSFSMLKSLLPEPQDYAGKVSAKMKLYSALDEHLEPVLNSVLSKGQLHTYNLELRNSKLFGTMADLLKDEKWRTPAPNNLTINYEIKDGRMFIEPVNMLISQTKVEITGDQGLDMTLNYKINAITPTSSIGSGATDILGKIPGGANIKEIKITGTILGTATKPEVKLGVADMTGAITDALKAKADEIKTQATEAVTKKVEDVKTQVKEDVSKKVDEIMAEAQKQADNIRSTSKQTADQIRSEAKANADKLEKEAKNPVEKAAKKAAADKLRSEGEANAKKVEQEGEKNATAVLKAEKKRADDIKNAN
jgi:vacuolar-type H+-ATPase subunit H